MGYLEQSSRKKSRDNSKTKSNKVILIVIIEWQRVMSMHLQPSEQFLQHNCITILNTVREENAISQLKTGSSYLLGQLIPINLTSSKHTVSIVVNTPCCGGYVLSVNNNYIHAYIYTILHTSECFKPLFHQDAKLYPL
jgi:hypothetical protein